MRNLLFCLGILNIFLGYLPILKVEAAMIDAESCSMTDVQAAINSADNGDTVIVPACTAVWDSRIILDKALTIKGQTTGCPGNCKDGTIIKKFNFRVTANNIRITGFTFNGNITGAGPLQMKGSHNFRIDHNKFYHFSSRAFRPDDRSNSDKTYSYGVLDHNLFDDCIGDGGMAYPIGDGNEAYNRDTGKFEDYERGTIFFEDNVIRLRLQGDGKNIMDAGEGGRYVIRYNIIEDTSDHSWGYWFENHGRCYGMRDGPDNAGVLEMDFYNNVVTRHDNGWGVFYAPRSGRGVFYNNTFLGNWVDHNIILFRLYEACGSAGCVGNCIEYPCPQQINNFYIWGNTDSNGNINSPAIVKGCNTYIKENRDYWDDIGADDNNFHSGSAMSKPQTCNINDCYWDQDNKKLYRCTQKDTWQLVYEQYPYPHPLVKDTSNAPPADAPGSLKILPQ